MHWEGNSKRTYCDERLLIKSKNAIPQLVGSKHRRMNCALNYLNAHTSLSELASFLTNKKKARTRNKTK